MSKRREIEPKGLAVGLVVFFGRGVPFADTFPGGQQPAGECCIDLVENTLSLAVADERVVGVDSSGPAFSDRTQHAVQRTQSPSDCPEFAGLDSLANSGPLEDSLNYVVRLLTLNLTTIGGESYAFKEALEFPIRW